jgi:hypothetical protein
LARTFPKWVKKAEEMMARRERLGNTATTLRSLLDEISREQKNRPNPLWIRIQETREDIEAMGLGLALFERRIFFEQRVAHLNLFRLKVTRKSKASSKTLSAGQIATIKWLVEEVKRVTGKAHEGELKRLLDVTLGTEVSLDQVRDAQPERLKGGHWQWAARSLPEEMRRLPKEKRKPETGS